jgi:hypothetical protein
MTIYEAVDAFLDRHLNVAKGNFVAKPPKSAPG